MENKDNNKLSCTFCGKGQEEVRKLIAGPSVYICDECVDLCNDIIEEEVKAEDDEVLDVLPSPLEIFKQLDEYVIAAPIIFRSRLPSLILIRPFWPNCHQRNFCLVF